MRGRVAIAIVGVALVVGFLWAVSALSAVPGGTAIADTGKAVSDVGQVFAQGRTDGLILYALIIGTFLMFLALVALIFFGYRALIRGADERAHANEKCAEQAKAFADASNIASAAIRDAATAIASSASANMAFQQAQAAMMERLELELRERRRRT